MTEAALAELKPALDAMYSKMGRPSVPPEEMLRALLLQMLYSVRSERMLVEQLEYNLLFRWFVGLSLSERVWDATSFSKNRERLLESDIARQFFAAVLAQAKRKHLLTSERFTVDGTLIEAWASEQSYQQRPGPPPSKGSGHDGELLLRDTHASKTDPDATLYRKTARGGWRLSHMAHAVSENAYGLVVETAVSRCSPRQEREQGVRMLQRLGGHASIQTVAADTGYNEQDFVTAVEQMGAEAHVPPYRNTRRRSWVDAVLYTTERYRQSRRQRKWIERFFSWLKTTAGLRKTRHRGHRKLDWNFTFAAAAYNLVRMSTLLAARQPTA